MPAETLGVRESFSEGPGGGVDVGEDGDLHHDAGVGRLGALISWSSSSWLWPTGDEDSAARPPPLGAPSRVSP
jgi:hypothetical protein